MVEMRLKITWKLVYCHHLFGFDKLRLLLFAGIGPVLCKTFDAYIASVVLAWRGHAWVGVGLIPAVFSYWTLLQYYHCSIF